MDVLKPITTRNGPGLSRSVIAVQTIDGDPFKLWNLYEDSGVIYLATCEQVDLLPTNWKVIDTLDIDAAEASICFDGDFIWHKDVSKWKLHTDSMPWIFWVNSYGVLKAMKYGTSGPTDLSNNVSSLTSIRAWKNPLFPEQDQGIVVAYTQLGAVRYRNFCFQDTTKDFLWENERELDYLGDAQVERVTAFYLNDFRVGFALEDTSGNAHWAITPRNWAGMASPIESLVSGVTDLQFDITPIRTYIVGNDEEVAAEEEFGSTVGKAKWGAENLSAAVSGLGFYVCPPTVSPAPDITGVERLAYEDRQTITLTFNYELACDLDRFKLGLLLKDSANRVLPIESVTQSGNVLTLKTVNKIDTMYNLTLTYSNIGNYYLAVRINETCVVDYGKVIDLSIPGKPPGVEENLTVFMDVMFNVIELGTIKTTSEENLTAAVSNLTFTVTPVQTYVVGIGGEPINDELEAVIDQGRKLNAEKLSAGVGVITFTVTQTGTSPI